MRGLSLCVALWSTLVFFCDSYQSGWARDSHMRIHSVAVRRWSRGPPLQSRPLSSTRLYFLGDFLRLIKANINSILRSWEDPEKVLDQALRDMNGELASVRQSYAQITASAKQMQRQQAESQGQIEEWYARAQSALQRGDEALATLALSERHAAQSRLKSQTQQLAAQADAQNKLREAMSALEAKIQQAAAQRNVFVARAKTAKTSLQVHALIDNLSSSSTATQAFDRMKNKVEALEIEAEICAEGSALTSKSTADVFQAHETQVSVEEELRRLKQSLHSFPTTLPVDKQQRHVEDSQVLLMVDAGNGKFEWKDSS